MGNIRYKEDTPVGEISPLAIWYAKNNANVYGNGGPRRDRNYNTILTPEQEAKYREWVKTLPANLQSDYDYDLRGAWLVGDVPDENGHMTDYWKKPWHPTFSVESRYNSAETPGGEWHGEEFVPSWYNNVLDGYRRYWAGNEFAKGGPIHIKPENRGKFTAAANRAGKSVQAYASQILAHKDNYSPTLVKRANFARNAAKWHAAGGSLGGPDDPPGGFTLNIKSPMERFYSEQAEREKQGVMAADQTARQVPVVQTKPIAVKAVQENAATQGLVRNIAEVQAQQEGYTSAEEKEKTEAMAADLARIEANRGEIKPYEGSMRSSTDRTPNAGIFAASTPKENLRTATNLGMTAALFTPGVGLLASPYFFLRGANNFYQAGQNYGDGEFKNPILGFGQYATSPEGAWSFVDMSMLPAAYKVRGRMMQGAGSLIDKARPMASEAWQNARDFSKTAYNNTIAKAKEIVEDAKDLGAYGLLRRGKAAEYREAASNLEKIKAEESLLSKELNDLSARGIKLEDEKVKKLEEINDYGNTNALLYKFNDQVLNPAMDKARSALLSDLRVNNPSLSDVRLDTYDIAYPTAPFQYKVVTTIPGNAVASIPQGSNLVEPIEIKMPDGTRLSGTTTKKFLRGRTEYEALPYRVDVESDNPNKRFVFSKSKDAPAKYVGGSEKAMTWNSPEFNNGLQQYLENVRKVIGEDGIDVGSARMIADGWFSGVPGDLEILTTRSRYNNLEKKLNFEKRRETKGGTGYAGYSPMVFEGRKMQGGSGENLDINIIEEDSNGHAIGVEAHQLAQHLLGNSLMNLKYTENANRQNPIGNVKAIYDQPIEKPDGSGYFTAEELFQLYKKKGDPVRLTLYNAMAQSPIERGNIPVKKMKAVRRAANLMYSDDNKTISAVAGVIKDLGKQVPGYKSGTEWFKDLKFDDVAENEAFLKAINWTGNAKEDAKNVSKMKNIFNYWYLRNSIATRSNNFDVPGTTATLDDILFSTRQFGNGSGYGGGNNMVMGAMWGGMTRRFTGAGQYHLTKHPHGITSLTQVADMAKRQSNIWSNPNTVNVVNKVFRAHGLSPVSSNRVDKAFFTDDLYEAVRDNKLTMREADKIAEEISDALDVAGYKNPSHKYGDSWYTAETPGLGWYFGATRKPDAYSMRAAESSRGNMYGYEFGTDYVFEDAQNSGSGNMVGEGIYPDLPNTEGKTILDYVDVDKIAEARRLEKSRTDFSKAKYTAITTEQLKGFFLGAGFEDIDEFDKMVSNNDYNGLVGLFKYEPQLRERVNRAKRNNIPVKKVLPPSYLWRKKENFKYKKAQEVEDDYNYLLDKNRDEQSNVISKKNSLSFPKSIEQTRMRNVKDDAYRFNDNISSIGVPIGFAVALGGGLLGSLVYSNNRGQQWERFWDSLSEEEAEALKGSGGREQWEKTQKKFEEWRRKDKARRKNQKK